MARSKTATVAPARKPKKQYKLLFMVLPFMVIVLLFNYVPIFGWIYSVFDYVPGVPILECDFMGLDYFKMIMKDANVIRALKNTFIFAGISIILTPLPMIFAILLNEIKSGPVRKFVQTFTTLPNFISWVLVYAIAFCIFSTDGFVSSLMVNAGIWKEGVNMLMGGSHVWLQMLAWGLWKGIGWSAIIYIAAISGIDQQLYEAATVDGAGRFQRMWNITVPSLIPTFCVLLLMSIANILSNGMDQYLVFENSTNTSSIMVLDLYVYKLGIGQGQIPLSTVIGMVKSVVSVTLLFAANGISKLIRGESIV